ncbi:MAG TPA: DegT/DnrJ/EryC1/StrS family aminotransferase [Gammaproteobacteria bacterium]|nr:DegT/DnrJ/EryC1/StrS family aminotransferase [Gammaproteobacteria bacterium]
MKSADTDFIRYIRPEIPPPEEWLPHLRESYELGYFTNTGPAVRRFEAALAAKYARGRAAVSGPNATNALVAALDTLGVHRGRVLTPSYTFPATAQAIRMVGAEPEFCDIDPETWELDPAAVRSRLARGGITAIMHVRAYGFGHDLDWLESAAREHGVPLLIDSAAALGGASSISGHVGQQGDIEVFSLHATKVFAIGEGSVTLMHPELEQRYRRVSNFGIGYPDVQDPGLNSKLSDFQAAVGLAVLDHIDAHIAHRQRIAARYREDLTGLPQLHRLQPPTLSPWQSYPVLLGPGVDAGRVLERALASGLELKRGYYRPLHQTTRFGSEARLPVTEQLAGRVVCLPVYSSMPEHTAGEVLRRFRAALD